MTRVFITLRCGRFNCLLKLSQFCLRSRKLFVSLGTDVAHSLHALLAACRRACWSRLRRFQGFDDSSLFGQLILQVIDDLGILRELCYQLRTLIAHIAGLFFKRTGGLFGRRLECSCRIGAALYPGSVRRDAECQCKKDGGCEGHPDLPPPDLGRTVGETLSGLRFIGPIVSDSIGCAILLFFVQPPEERFLRLFHGPQIIDPLLILWAQIFSECCHPFYRCSLVFTPCAATIWTHSQMGIQLRLFLDAQFVGRRGGAQLKKFLMRAHWSNASTSHRIPACNTRTIAFSIPLQLGDCEAFQGLCNDDS